MAAFHKQAKQESSRPEITSPDVRRSSATARGGAGSENTEQTTERPNNSSLRRLACDGCRDRKVRCDKQSPTCSRCAKVGITCCYTSQQAEAQLAFNPLIRNPQQLTNLWDNVAMEPTVSMSPLPEPSPGTGSPPSQFGTGLSTHDPHSLSVLADNIMADGGIPHWGANFARAWMTLGRAIIMAKIMGLDRMDDHCSVRARWGLPTQLDLPSDAAALEEKRRTFWLLYIFDTFANIKTKLDSAFDRLIFIPHGPLPSPGEFRNLTEADDEMPSLQLVFELSQTPPLSSFAATAIMVSLYRRCSDHIQSSLRDESYAFWETHYHIGKVISHCRKNLMVQHLSSYSSNDPLCLTLRMCLDTVEINLHEAALAKAQTDELPVSLTTESISKCVSAASGIVEAAQLGQQLTDKKLEMFRQLDHFLILPITAAIQVCFRMLYHGEENMASAVNSLRVLSSFMRDVVDPEHIAPGLLEKAEAQVADAEPLSKKRRVLEK
ncbi:hypothetical protein DL766_003773 [Monosporascus sp. MC13-8B]|nr:hypothetical protein DL763_000261 [Monosporascus cannonballus]RYP32884.1 hypothetical protein DL766_003773 [Monosporascus sp. MC13-8B]